MNRACTCPHCPVHQPVSPAKAEAKPEAACPYEHSTVLRNKCGCSPNTAAKLASDPALAAQVKQHVEARNPVRETIPVVRIKRGLGLEESGVREIKIDGEHFPMAYVIVEATKPEADSVWKMADQEAEGRGNMRSMTLNLTDAESEAIENIAKSVEMTKTAVIRQGLRLYQLVHTKAKAGEKLAFTKDGKLVELIISGAGWPGMD